MKKLAQSAAACAAAALLLVAGAAMAAPLSQAQQRYQQERAACMSGASNQDRATCLQEAGAALQEARRSRLASGDERELAANRLQRCAALPEPERQECTLRMQGQGSTSGTAQQGGIVRELVRPVPARAPN